MLKRYHYIFGTLFRIMDALVLALSWIGAYWLRFHVQFLEVTKGLPPFYRYVSLTPSIVIVWLVVFSGMHIYASKRLLRQSDELFVLLRAHLAALTVLIAATTLISEYLYSRAVMLTFGVVSLCLLIFVRILLRAFLRGVRRRGYNLRSLLAVSFSPASDQLLAEMIKKIACFPELGVRCQHISSEQNCSLAESVAALKPDILLTSGVLPSALDALVRECNVSDIILVPEVAAYATLGCRVDEFEGLPFLHINEVPMTVVGAFWKRMTDLVLSFLALILLAPFFLLIACVIALSSPGPIFYRQERMSLDGSTFWMFKFRSMQVNAEEESGAVFARKNDTRRTVLGAFLRATSLDELPQLWNVLKGDMSLVGPRPERPMFVQQFRQQLPYYMFRHRVKSGITGWAQVNGWRGDTSLERRLECDLYYIKNWSYSFDLKIIVLTLIKGFVHKNAY